MDRKMIWAIVAVVAILAAAGGYVYYTNNQATATEGAATEELQTTQVRTGSITVSATGAGTVIPAQEINLAFTTSGRIKELLVKVGDAVAAGDTLARVENTDARQSLVNAQLQYAQAAMQTDASATQAGISYDDITVENAQMSLDDAQTALDEMLNFAPDAVEIALLEAQLAAAQASYNAAIGQQVASNNNVTIEQISLEQTRRALDDAQAAYDTAYDPGRDWELNDARRAAALEAERDRAADSLLRAQESLRVAELNYNATVSTSGSSSTASAQTSLLSAQQALDTARSGPTEDEIAAARATVRKAELALKQAQLNQEANTLSLKQAELNVAAAQEAVDGTVLTSPIDGVITAINGNVGETVSGVVITVADLEQPMLEIYLDESDLNMVGLGYEVEVTFDALPDDIFAGSVVQVDPQLTVSNGVSAVRALVRLDTESFNKPQTLPAGLNATVEVIGGRAENALLVPVEALREITSGTYAVFVMVNGEPELRMVEVGLMDYSFAEILSGVAAGDTITTGVIKTDDSSDTTSSGQTQNNMPQPPFDMGGPPPGGF